MNEHQILKADPVYRKKVLRIFFSALLVGLLLLSLVIPMLEKAAATNDPGKALLLIKYILVALLVLPAILSALILRIALKSIKCRMYPPPGTKVLKDTPVFSEAEAVKRGWILLFLTLVLIFVCLVTAGMAFFLMGTLF